MKFSPMDSILTEKYRPRKVSEMVGDFRTRILQYLENPKALPNFIFYSTTVGSGKTTVCKAIINELGCDYLIINSSDERGIESVREKIKDFAMTMSSKEGMKRCVFLDEADGLTIQAQEALRNTMETYSSNVFFLLTCNKLVKIINPIQSRCVVISFAYPDKDEVKKYLEMIANNEKMDYTEEGMDRLIEYTYPSIRNAVISIQDLKTQNKAIFIENIRPANEVFDTLWGYLKEKRWLDIKKEVLSSTINPRELNTFFWQKALDESNTKLIQLTCRNEKDFVIGADPKIVFITSLIEAVKIEVSSQEAYAK
jgi:DNA polymerase III delta prime subunit